MTLSFNLYASAPVVNVLTTTAPPTPCDVSSYPAGCTVFEYAGYASNEPATLYGKAQCPTPFVPGDVKDYETVTTTSYYQNVTFERPKNLQCVEACEQLTHEPGGTIDETACNVCSDGYVPVDGSGYTAPFQCMRNREPQECADQGLAEAQTSEGNFCLEECEHGMFNGVCLPPPEPQNECSKDSPDYRGVIVQGYGKPVIPACGDFDQCSDGSPGKVGFVNGELRCIADDYGQENECAADEIFIVDQYGVICAGLEDVPEEEPTPEDPNTDTDGDGQPDEYNPDNDPNINRKQLDDLNEGQDQANKSLSNLEKIGKGTNDRLDDIGSELENNSKGIGEVVGFTRQSAESLAEIKDGMKAPEGGFNPDGFGGLIPTFEETGNAFIQAIGSSPQVQALTDFATIPQVNVCPVYTLPATPVSGEITMDIHCSIIERHRSMIGAVFMFFWVGLSLLIFFKA